MLMRYDGFLDTSWIEKSLRLNRTIAIAPFNRDIAVLTLMRYSVSLFMF